jgi:adenine/guanine phosphoribosyltransferase-like PRPP-binding protein
LSLLPHQFWQAVYPAGTHSSDPKAGFEDSYPAVLPDDRQILLPVRILPGDGNEAVCSLIVNQASFAVEDALTESMAGLAQPFAPEIVIGVPTLGLPLANGVARRLNHPRMVALGTSRKFWYSDDLSEPLSSITSPAHGKTIFLDPRMLPVLEGKRVVLVDDVVSSGTSACAVLRLLAKAGIKPAAMIVAMLQGDRWRAAIEAASPGMPVLGAIASPRLGKSADGRWRPVS